jgi:CHAT domain-containing protein/Tfp pilus assembly protein PilF
VGIYKTILTGILAVLLALPQQGTAQDTQEAFSEVLTAAALAPDIPQVRNLISEHRFWVKPVVNKLISDYINRTMMGNKGAAQARKGAILLIGQEFRDIYGERSLYMAYSYLETWSMEHLGKKAQADRIYSVATDMRLNSQDPRETIAKYMQALQLYGNIGDVRGQGEVLGGLGAVYWYIDPDTCLSFYKQALKARTEADDKVLIGAMLNGIGGVYFQHFWELDSAKTYYERAAQVRQEIGDLSGLGTTMFYLASVYEAMSRHEDAFRSFEKSYLIYQELGNQIQMALSKLYAGTNLQKLGRYMEALGDLETARDICLELSDTVDLADVYTQLALVYDNMGDYDTAVDQVTMASGLYQQVGDQWGLAGTYNHTGIILQDADRKKRAEEFYLKSLEIYRQLDDQENVISLLNNLGTVTFEQNDFEHALAYNRQGLELSRSLEFKAGELPCLINLANTLNRLNQLDSAMIHYEKALQLSMELDSPDSEWRILVGIAENYKLRGDYTRSIEYNEKGLRIIEDLRSSLHSMELKSTYLARERYAYEDVIHMLTDLHQKEPGKGYDLLAFEYAQRCKSRSFLEQIKGSEPVSLKQIQEALPDKNSVIMEYSLGDSSSVLWVITPDAYRMIRLPDRNTLEQQVETLRFALMNPDQDNLSFFQQTGYFLYSQLIQPAETFLTKKSRITILPDGILHYIPFEVLLTRESVKDKDQLYGKMAYLGNKYPLCYGQSASVYLSMLEQSSAARAANTEMIELVAFGDPDYKDTYKRLEFSGEEVQGIAGLFPEGSVRTFLGEGATEENAKTNNLLPAAKRIHFATHGVVDDKNPGRSGLVLSQEKSTTEDGILRAEEISGMSLHADLVVLSACQSGLGRMIRGEGMIGLSRSFMHAGVSSVVVSLWSVSDQSTNLLMQLFYENLILQSLSPADALQQARISMIRENTYAHPFYWAPFILIGNYE